MKVLVVDDTEAGRHLLRKLLLKEGNIVVEAKNGLEALEVLKKGGIDLVVSDILMPWMDGFTLLRKMRAHEELQDIPLVFCTTTYTEAKDEDFALKMGADGFIRKPVKPGEFLRIIKGVMGDSKSGNRGKPILDKEEDYRAYSERLVKKLEDKMLELEESEGKYRDLVEISPDLIAIHDTERMLYINPAGARMLGFKDLKDIVGKNILDLIHPEQLKEVKRLMHYIPYDERHRDFVEGSFKRADGTTLDYEVFGTPITYQGRQARQIILRDITERKAAEEALKRSEKRYRDLLDNSLVGIYQTNLKGDILYVNDALVKMAGAKSPEEMKSISVSMKYKDPKVREKLIQKLKEKGWVDNFEIETVNERGENKNVLISSTLEGDVISGAMMDITERKRSEEEIERLKNFSESIIDESPAIIEVVDRDLVVKAWNKAAEDYVNIKKKDIVGRKFFEVLPSLKKLGWDKIFKDVMETGEPYLAKDYKITRTFGQHKGETLYQNVSVAPLYEGSEIVGAIITINDITERKKAEESLLESEERYRSLFENSIEGIAISKGNEAITANKAVLEMFGYDSVEEFKSIPLMDHVASESRELILDRIKKRQRGETLDPFFRYKIRCKDGSIKDVEATTTGVVIKNELYSLGTFRDITERKQAEEALKESEEKYRFLAQNMTDLVVIQDMDLNITYSSPSVTDLFGYSVEETYDLKLKELMTADSLRKAMESFQKYLSLAKEKEDIDIPPMEFEYIRKDGSTFWGELKVTFLRDPQGRLVGSQGVIRDITEHKRAEEALGESEARFRHLSEAAFEAIVTHDKGLVLEANDQFYAMFGYRADELLGKQTISKIVAPEAREFMKKQIEIGALGPYESIGVRKDGTRFPMEIRVRESEFKGRPVRVGAIMDITARKKAEEQLAIFKKFAETSSLGYGFADLNGNINYSNPTLCRMLGGEKPEDVLGKNVSEYYPEAMRLKLVNEILPTVKNEGQWFGELPLMSIHGDITPTIQNISLISDDKGNPLYFGNAITDITERKKAEEALRKSKEDWRHIFNSISDSVMILDVNHRILRVNPATMKASGLNEDELVGRNCYEIFHCSEGPAEGCPHEKLIKTRHPETMEMEMEALGGIYLITVAPIFDASGKMTQVLHIAKDITEKKKAEDLLNHHLAELSAICEIDRNIIENPGISSLLRFIVSRAQSLTHTDAAFFGFVEGDRIVHRTFTGIRTKEFKRIRLKRGEGLGWLAVKKKKPLTIEDYPSEKKIKKAPYNEVRKEGLISFLAVPFMSAEAKPIGVLYVASRKKRMFTGDDIRTLETLAGQTSVAVEHAKLNEEIKKSYDELKSLDELKANITANVSHELRTPITIANAALELALDEDDPREVTSFMATARDALARQNIFIDNLLEAVRLERGPRRPLTAPVELSKAVSTVLDEFAPMALKVDVTLEKDIPKELPKLKVNRELLLTVLRNLVNNALKFNKPGGRITIRAREKKGFVEVSVKDTGIGISKETLTQVFERFYQVDSSSERTYGGTGMGLAIVKEAVEEMGGKLRVRSRKGSGSTFCFTLPVQK